jgi:hypothetical protein
VSPRERYNMAVEQRITAWQRNHASVSRVGQEAEPAEPNEVRAAFPEHNAIRSQALQAALARLDKTYQGVLSARATGREGGASAV